MRGCEARAPAGRWVGKTSLAGRSTEHCRLRLRTGIGFKMAGKSENHTSKTSCGKSSIGHGSGQLIDCHPLGTEITYSLPSILLEDHHFDSFALAPKLHINSAAIEPATSAEAGMDNNISLAAFVLLNLLYKFLCQMRPSACCGWCVTVPGATAVQLA